MKLPRPYLIKIQDDGIGYLVVDKKTGDEAGVLETSNLEWRVRGRYGVYSTRMGAADAAWRGYAKRRSE